MAKTTLQGCLYCKHWNSVRGTTCAAFPNGIPLPILSWEVPHTKRLPDDNGIMFEPVEDDEADAIR